jgi:hypothetical protein
MFSFIAFVLALGAILKFTKGGMRIALAVLLVLGGILIAIG